MVIKKQGSKWILYDRAGTKKLGTHPSRKSAVRQERAVNISKARAAGHRIPLKPKVKA